MSTVTTSPEQIAEYTHHFVPELHQKGAELQVFFDEAANRWKVTASRGGESTTVEMTPEDADHFINGVECPYLCIALREFLN